MENVRLPDSARLPGIEGLKGPLSCLTQARYGIAWGVIGAAVDCYETAVEYSTQRKQFSRPIGRSVVNDQYFRTEVTDLVQNRVEMARLVVDGQRGE